MALLEAEFGFAVPDSVVVQSVRDVLLAARSNVVGVPSVELKPVPAAWFADEPLTTSAQIPAGEFIAEVFLNQGRLGPNRVILADQAGGLKTYREMIAAICARMPDIARLPGTHVGIMLPASAAEGVIYLATLFAGETLVIKENQHVTEWGGRAASPLSLTEQTTLRRNRSETRECDRRGWRR